MLSKLALLFFLTHFVIGNAVADDLKVREGFTRLSYDHLSVPIDEKM